MSRPGAAVVLVALVTALTAGPADAGAQHSAGASVGPTGLVASQWVPNGDTQDEPTAYSVTPDCLFGTVFTPDNRVLLTFGGTAAAAGQQITQLTYLKCTVSNQVGQTDSAEFANGGPFSHTAKSTVLWEISPIVVCVEAFALFGPTPVTIADAPRRCSFVLL